MPRDAVGRVAEVDDLRVAEHAEAEPEVERRAGDDHEVRFLQRDRPRARERELVIGRRRCRGPCRSRTPARARSRPRRAAGARRGPSTRRRRRRPPGAPPRAPARRSRAIESGSGSAPRDLLAARRVRDLRHRPVDEDVERHVDERRAAVGRAGRAQRGVEGRRESTRSSAPSPPASPPGSRIGTGSSSCSEPEPQRSAGARPPIAIIGDPLSCGRGQRAHPVRHARARGQRADTDPAGDLGPPLGRERRRLLVADVDETDVGLHAPVVEREEVTAREGEDRVDVVAAEHLGREPSARAELLACRLTCRHAAGDCALEPRPRNPCERGEPRRPGSRTAASARRPGSPTSSAPGIVSAISLRHAEERLVLLTDDHERRAAHGGELRRAGRAGPGSRGPSSPTSPPRASPTSGR